MPRGKNREFHFRNNSTFSGFFFYFFQGFLLHPDEIQSSSERMKIGRKSRGPGVFLKTQAFEEGGYSGAEGLSAHKIEIGGGPGKAVGLKGEGPGQKEGNFFLLGEFGESPEKCPQIKQGGPRCPAPGGSV